MLFYLYMFIIIFAMLNYEIIPLLYSLFTSNTNKMRTTANKCDQHVSYFISCYRRFVLTCLVKSKFSKHYIKL